MRNPLVVYLDSSDFSTLSDAARATPENLAVRDALIGHARSGKVLFAFSGVHLNEMSPMEATFTPSAIGRTDLLVELCQRNAFISIDRLLDAETARLGHPGSPPVKPLTTDATWFPEIGDFLSPMQWVDTMRTTIANIQGNAVNRDQRRKLQRKLGNGSTPSTKVQRLISTPSREALAEIMRSYPMRRDDALVLLAYIHGKASAKDGEAAFLASLRDPRWMMQWFSEHHTKMSPAIQWLRSASINMVDKMQVIARSVEEQRRIHPEAVGDFLQQKWWRQEQDNLLTNIAARVSRMYDDATDLTADEVDVMCPGLSCMTRTLHSVLWDAIAASPRAPKRSDPVDAMHALYAPYSDIFRADRYMAPHIQRQVKTRGVRVVSRLTDLPSLIDECLR